MAKPTEPAERRPRRRWFPRLRTLDPNVRTLGFVSMLAEPQL